MRVRLRDMPSRVATGAYILHSGWEKWGAPEERAQRVQGAAAVAVPLVSSLPPRVFLKALAGAEIALGAALLTPVVPNVVAGAGLTAFSAALLTMYLRTPSMHRPGSVWPTPQGIALSKDVWMLGVGLNLVASAD